jgi:hypothetical protein
LSAHGFETTLRYSIGPSAQTIDHRLPALVRRFSPQIRPLVQRVCARLVIGDELFAVARRRG